jgi:hypothetical protein
LGGGGGVKRGNQRGNTGSQTAATGRRRQPKDGVRRGRADSARLLDLVMQSRGTRAPTGRIAQPAPRRVLFLPRAPALSGERRGESRGGHLIDKMSWAKFRPSPTRKNNARPYLHEHGQRLADAARRAQHGDLARLGARGGRARERALHVPHQAQHLLRGARHLGVALSFDRETVVCRERPGEMWGGGHGCVLDTKAHERDRRPQQAQDVGVGGAARGGDAASPAADKRPLPPPRELFALDAPQ